MFSIDSESSCSWYFIYRDGKEFCRVAKEGNTLDDIKKYFNIKEG